MQSGCQAGILLLLQVLTGCTSPQQLMNSLESENDTFISMTRTSGFGSYGADYRLLILRSGLVYVDGNFHPYSQSINTFKTVHVDSMGVDSIINLALTINFFAIADTCHGIIDEGSVLTTIKWHGKKKSIRLSHGCWNAFPDYANVIRLQTAIDSLASIK